MWCFDPISEYVTLNKDSTRKSFDFGKTVIEGYFTKDFRKPGLGVKKEGKYVGIPKVSSKEKLLFPVDYPLLLEPTDNQDMIYLDPEDETEKSFPNFQSPSNFRTSGSLAILSFVTSTVPVSTILGTACFFTTL